VLALDAAGHAAPAPAAASSDATDFHGLITRDPAMLQVIQVVKNVAETDATVLIRGESGTGKELVARAIHLESPRREGPFVAVNCAAFTPTLLESELFGHTKGAFTGAVAARKGIFAQADGGTLFLDEVAELPLDLQAKLLRVLQERTFVPIGATEPVRTDVRVIAATHRSLREEVAAGRFREDLMFRLRVVPLFLPSLRQRRLDVELLLRHFVDEFNRKSPRVVTGVAPEAMRALLDHSWPGNVRELRNVVEYAFAVSRSPVITLDELPVEFREKKPAPAARAPQPETGRDAARVVAALEEAGGDIDRAAEILGVSRTTFWRMRKRAGVL
jgi:two-component system response regulator AtoC